MSVATSRTARYGGAAATFSTVASPGAPLATLFAVADAALLAAGWTQLVNNGSPGPNYYTSNGESGNEKIFLYLTTGAYGVASGTQLPGGSFLICGTAQWLDPGGGAKVNAIGAAKLSSTPLFGFNVLSLGASTTWEYALVCDKDGILIVATPSTAANTACTLVCGLAQRPTGQRENLTTTGTLAAGSGVTVNVASNPITAGYRVGDIVQIAAQEAGGSIPSLGDLVCARISTVTSTSVTFDSVAGLSKASLAAGALIGDAVQPYYGIAYNQQTDPMLTALFICTPGIQKVGTNLWSLQMSADGNGDLDGATSPLSAFIPSADSNVGAPLLSSGVEKRTGANHMRPLRLNSGTFCGGFTKYLYRDQRQTGFPQATGLIARRLQTTEEYVTQQGFSTGFSYYMGPFPATTPTQLVRLLPATDDLVFEGAVLPGAISSSDDAQIALMDRIYPFDYGALVNRGNPQVVNVTPSTGTTINFTDQVQFDITDQITQGQFARILVVAQFLTVPSARSEVVHTGNAFGPGYSGSVTPISNGFRYVVQRQGGWPASQLLIVPYAIDTLGTENP